MAEAGMRRQVFAWSVYDLANTIYSALFITLFFPSFVKDHLGGTEAHIGTVVGLSTIASVLVVPVVGALSDRMGRRMPFLIGFTLLCCAATATTSVVGLYGALAMAVVSNFFYSIALAVYDALLPKLAPEGERGTVSGLGTAVGYLGTPFSIAVLFLLRGRIDFDTEEGVRLTFLLTAGLFLLFALYPFLVIREPKQTSGRALSEDLKESFRAIGRTLRTVHRVPGFLMFLGAAFLFSNAINAVIVFLYTFSGERLGLSPQDFLPIYAGMAVAAAVGSFLNGLLTDRIGPRKVLLFSGVLWLVVLAILMAVDTLTPFVVAGCLGGVALGAYWTASRPLLIRFAGSENMGQYFGFLALVNKASGALGPLVFGPVAAWYGYGVGLWLLMGFFIGGMILLRLVPRDTLSAPAS